MEEKILVVDNINFYNLIVVLAKFRSAKTIFYLRKQKDIFSRMIFKMFSKRGWHLEPIRCTLSMVDGVSPYRELDRLIVEKMKVCEEKYFSDPLNKLKGVSEYERTRLSARFSKYAGWEIYFDLQLFTLLNTKFTSKNNIDRVLLRKTPFSDVVKEVYQKAGLAPHFYSGFGSRKNQPRDYWSVDQADREQAVSFAKDTARAISLLSYSILCKFMSLFVIRNRLIKKHKICALIHSHVATDLLSCMPSCISQDHWDLKSEILSASFSRFPKKALDFYRERSDKLVVYSFNPLIGNKSIELVKTWSYFINEFFKNMRLYRRLFGLRGLNGWMSKRLLNIVMLISFFEGLFRVNGTRLLWLMTENDSQTQMAAMAINRLGGASLGSTYSNVRLPVWTDRRNQHDVFFVWGRRLLDARKDNNDRVAYFVIAGYVEDAMFEREFERGKEFRSLLINQYGAKNILTFYDTGYAYDSVIAPEQGVDMYKEFFAWLEEGRGNFIVFKCKRPNILNRLLSNHPVLKERMDGFCKKGRILVLFDKAAIYPGLAADAVLSVSPTLGSLTAVLGRPLIFYDIQEVYQKYPFLLPNVRTITRTEEIRQALNITMEESHRLGYPEKLKPIKGSAIDPFVDGKSSHRIQEYMANILNMLEGGSSKAEAIDFANERYREKWGHDTVVAGSLSGVIKE